MKMSTNSNRTLAVALLAVAFAAMSSAMAQAGPITYTAVLNGANETPPIASPGTGFATVVYDDVAHTMLVSATFQDLLGTTTAAHIHAATAVAGTGTAGVATTTPTFPVGVTSGSYSSLFDLTLASSYSSGYLNNAINLGNVTTAEASLAQALVDGTAYFNIHTTFAPGGEIRGFLQPVPEPGSSIVLLGLGVAGLAARRLRRRWLR
ncbi:MAG: CHRD domain-containing protein [Vicinamibacterales bacterium]